jgi:hypothetical protein
MLLDLLCFKWHSMSQMLVIPHRFKKIGVHNLVVCRIFSDILLVLGLRNVEKQSLGLEMLRNTGLNGYLTMPVHRVKAKSDCFCRKSNPGRVPEGSRLQTSPSWLTLHTDWHCATCVRVRLCRPSPAVETIACVAEEMPLQKLGRGELWHCNKTVKWKEAVTEILVHLI